jgi:hypothetical protein
MLGGSVKLQATRKDPKPQWAFLVRDLSMVEQGVCNQHCVSIQTLPRRGSLEWLPQANLLVPNINIGLLTTNYSVDLHEDISLQHPRRSMDLVWLGVRSCV